MLLFCYGSLEFKAVMRVVTGRCFAGEPATLGGFARYRVRDADFPGLIPEPGARTEGTLWRGIDPAALAVLDRFEGALYRRERLRVRCQDDRSAEAHVYVVSQEQRETLSREPWDKAIFARDGLRAFLCRLEVR